VTAPNDFNSQIVSEFRANGGKVGGMFASMPMLRLHSTGAQSGQERVSPLGVAPYERTAGPRQIPVVILELAS
jgi:hypothetical protein